MFQEMLAMSNNGGGVSGCQVASGTFTWNGFNDIVCECGFKPKLIIMFNHDHSDLSWGAIYIESFSTTQYVYWRGDKPHMVNFFTGYYTIKSVNDTGFVANANYNNTTSQIDWVAYSEEFE
jgi:hypothetical protein